jgi:hypothetical protein
MTDMNTDMLLFLYFLNIFRTVDVNIRNEVEDLLHHFVLEMTGPLIHVSNFLTSDPQIVTIE